MPSDAIWTSLITGGTGIMSGFLGYQAARLQPMLDARRVGAEQDRADRDARRALYLEYLGVVDESRRAYEERTATPDWHRGWWARFQDIDNRLELLGSSEAREASYALYNSLAAIWNEMAGTQEERYPEAYVDSFRKQDEAMQGERRDMLDAMRRDVQDKKTA